MSTGSPPTPEQPNTPPALDVGHEDHPEMISRNSRNGLILFAVYCVFYAGFMLLSAFAPQQMASRPLGGINLAILYGMGLIIGALFLAAIYMYLCRPIGNGNASGSTGSTDSNSEASK